jgi:hypothetical protein
MLTRLKGLNTRTANAQTCVNQIRKRGGGCAHASAVVGNLKPEIPGSGSEGRAQTTTPIGSGRPFIGLQTIATVIPQIPVSKIYNIQFRD